MTDSVLSMAWGKTTARSNTSQTCPRDRPIRNRRSWTGSPGRDRTSFLLLLLQAGYGAEDRLDAARRSLTERTAHVEASGDRHEDSVNDLDQVEHWIHQGSD